MLEFSELTADRWSDFEELFGSRGACGGCWCMWWRLSNKEYQRNKGEKNRAAMKKIVDSGRIPGIIAYHEKKPVGWCSIDLREEYRRLETSRILKPVDDRVVWSVVCFFIHKKFRFQGISGQLLREGIDHVRKNGGKLIEGYPVEPLNSRIPDVFAYQGLAGIFQTTGFREVARRSPARPIMRLNIIA